MRVQLVEYDPWGKVSREEGTSEASRRFTGKMLDPESGLYYYGGRYYDPELGRFISPDPFIGQPGDPQNLNRYSYVENNPVNYIDPSGYFSFKKLFKKIKKVFTKYVFPVFRIIVGIGQLATGNPMGFFNIASGASSFAKGRDAQLFSRISGFIADAGSTFPTGDTGPPSSGGSPFLGFEDEGGRGPTGSGGGSGSIWGWLSDTLGNLAATVEEVRAAARQKKGFPLPTTAIVGGSYYMAAKVWPGRPDVAIAPFFTSGFPQVGAEGFPGFTDIRSSLPPGSSVQIKLSLVVDTGSLRTGDSTLSLQGTLANDVSGNISFSGTISAERDLYNFNRPGAFNAVGRRLPGRPFWVEFVGRRPVSYP